MKYTIELEQADDGGWGGMINGLPGLFLMGATIDELLASVPDALELYFEDDETQTGHNNKVQALSIEIAA
jgi:predicted RNase H-like HicB family nuclease